MDSVTWDQSRYLSLLEKLIGETRHLQNNPPEQIPREDRAVRHILDVLEPWSTGKGGPLRIQHVSFVEGRGNLIVEYPGATDDCISVVGCHLDVVSANPEVWERDPFRLTQEGDRLFGRGTTDCLGHVAVLTLLMEELGRRQPKLSKTFVAVFIANEEELGIGVDELVRRGLLDQLKSGPMYWMDTADSQPCLGTGGMMVWKLKSTGRLFHSGWPSQAINSMELAMDALAELQRRFYKEYPASDNDRLYKFACSSSMKPTRWEAPPGTINIIPGQCSISGDVRLSPWYDCKDVIAKLKEWVEDINANIDKLPTRSPESRYDLRPDIDCKGKLEIEFAEEYVNGVACDMESHGFKVMRAAWDEVYGGCQPFSVTGSLPCVRDLKDAGFDLNIFGFGSMKVYHASNEYALLSDMENGFNVIKKLVQMLAEDGYSAKKRKL
eukprot:CAMPEP_0177609198 /NCGR_PEP_ID=MMETSP0419_2-20121207/18933_1 /TAXON_ID=582737 /ORGANISM="Tetraselmis sp., Strain GSL018" /LENGTH=437 /DNA_ID=CAMNT_0019104051 /DNA_START=132 /DNA_END=1446 /DNA_ORIENTATION=-